MTPHQQIVHGAQVLFHLAWFIFPLIAIPLAIEEWNNDGIYIAIAGIIAQTFLAVGYIYGWNVT